MTQKEKHFNLFSTVLRFLPFKITFNLKRIYLDIDEAKNRMTLLAVFEHEPSELELELFDDIVTNSNAHIPDYFIDQQHTLIGNFDAHAKHDFIVFAFHE